MIYSIYLEFPLMWLTFCFQQGGARNFPQRELISLPGIHQSWVRSLNTPVEIGWIDACRIKKHWGCDNVDAARPLAIASTISKYLMRKAIVRGRPESILHQNEFLLIRIKIPTSLIRQIRHFCADGGLSSTDKAVRKGCYLGPQIIIGQCCWCIDCFTLRNKPKMHFPHFR